MRKHAAIIRPKFEYLIGALDKELGGLEIGEWTRPIGGYFVSFDSLDVRRKLLQNVRKQESYLPVQVLLIPIKRIRMTGISVWHRPSLR